MTCQTQLKSCLCTQAQLEAAEFARWRPELCLPVRLQRKDWEFYFIAQALFEREMLGPGREGIGFAVGREPLPALFAKYGCSVLATDLADCPAARIWRQSGMHSAGLDELSRPDICPPNIFESNVRFEFVDMNAIPPALGPVDFVWSACALEHLGSLEAGARFILRTLECLRPGGIAVHTTEFNVSSNEETLVDGGTVLYRRRDIEALAAKLPQLGCELEVDFGMGDSEADWDVDIPPYTHDPMLKLQVGPFVTTSLGLIIEKPDRPVMSPTRSGGGGRTIGELYRHFSDHSQA